MSEFKMLAIAFTSMVAVSALSLAVLLGLKVDDAVLLCGTTGTAIATYLGACLYCLPRLKRPAQEPESDEDEQPASSVSG